MALWFADFDNGASGNSGKGVRKITFNSGGTLSPVIATWTESGGIVKNDILTGATSGATAYILNVTVSSGTWAGGDATGTIYISEPVGTFQNGENLDLSGTQTQANILTTTSTADYDCFQIIDHCTAAKGFAAGDVCLHKKSPDVVDSGTTGAFTKSSRSVTLGAAQTIDLCTCDTTTGWSIVYIFTVTAANATIGATYTNNSKTFTVFETIAGGTTLLCTGTGAPAASGTLTYASGTGDATITFSACSYLQGITASSSYGKLGSYTIRLQMPTSVLASQPYAVFDIGIDTDCSTMQKVNFWLRSSLAWTNLTTLLIKLRASDNSVLHTLTMPTGHVTANSLAPYVINNGSALANNVRKITIETSSAPGTAINSAYLFFDNMFASKASGINLNTIISLSSANKIDDNIWMPIKSITGTSLVIDNEINAVTASGRGYPLANQTASLYFREVFVNTSGQYFQVAGTSGNWDFQEGGWNLVTMTQEGESIFAGNENASIGVSMNGKAYTSVNRFGIVRNYSGYAGSGSNHYNSKIKAFSAIGCYYGASCSYNEKLIMDGYVNTNFNYYGFYDFGYIEQLSGLLNSNSNNNINIRTGGTWQMWKGIVAKNNYDYGINLYFSQNLIYNLVTADNSTGGIWLDSYRAGEDYLYNASIGESSEVGVNDFCMNRIVYSIKHDTSANNDIVWLGSACQVVKQATTKPADVSYAWKMSPTSNYNRQSYKKEFSLGMFKVNANKQLTVKIRMLKSNANINGDLCIKGGQIAGIPTDVTAASTNTTDWTDGNSLLTLTPTPTEAGFIEVLVRCWYPDGSSTHTYNVTFAPPAVDGDGNYEIVTQAT